MDIKRHQKAKCSRGRGPKHYSTRPISPHVISSPTSPASPNTARCNMQLRNPSERRPSKHYLDDDFEFPTTKSSQRDVYKTLKVELERMPIAAGQHMPMLEPYMHHDWSAEDSVSDVDSAPPPLLPEVIVTRGTKQRQQQPISETLGGSDYGSPPNKQRKIFFREKGLSSLLNLDDYEENDKKSTNFFRKCSPPKMNSLDTDKYNNLESMPSTSNFVNTPYRSSFHTNEDKTAMDQQHDGEDSALESLSDSQWSDSLDDLFREPERISTGREEKTTIDGVDFLSFETKEDLQEFTKMDGDYVHSYKTVQFDESCHMSKSVMETLDNHMPQRILLKTRDVTKIKGWQSKQNLGSFNSDYEHTVPELDNIDGEGMYNPSSKTGQVFSEQCPVKSNENKIKLVNSQESISNQSKHSQENELLKSNSKASAEQSNDSRPSNLSNLDESWVNFAVSALVLPSQGEHSKLEVNKSPENSILRDGLEESETCKLQQSTIVPVKGKGGKLVILPLSPSKTKKLANIPNDSSQSTEIILVHSQQGTVSDNKTVQSVKRTSKIVSNIVSTEEKDKIIEVSEQGKEKTSRELKKLGHVMIDIENRRKLITDDVSVVSDSKCTKEFCKLGCVCVSLDTIPQPVEHCGKVDCMFECTCTTLPHIAVERLIEDEKRDFAPAEKDFRNTVIRADNGLMMVKERGRREIKVPGRFRDENVLVGDALLAAEQKIYRGRCSNKTKAIKDHVDEPKSSSKYEQHKPRKSLLNEIKSQNENVEEPIAGSSKYQHPRARKSLLNDIKTQNLAYDDDLKYNVPSPEILKEPVTGKSSVLSSNSIEMKSLYDVGGFISLDREEKFLALQKVRIKQEKCDEDCTIEIDEMGWERLEISNDSLMNSETEQKPDDVKIVSITSLTPEEFECPSSMTLPVASNENAHTNDLLKAIDIEKSVPNSSTHLNTVNSPMETPCLPTELINIDRHAEKLNRNVSPIDQRIAAKLRAKKLAEFFSTNLSVSTLIKSAYEFRPSVLQTEAITLLQWSSLKARYFEGSIQLWIKNSERDFHFLVTDTLEPPSSEYVNLLDYKITESSIIPEVARQMQHEYTGLHDCQRCCILWCNGKHWEFIGTLLKNKIPVPSTNSKIVSTIHLNSEPKVLLNTVQLPNEVVDTKWFSVVVKNDFEAVELKNERIVIPYSKINQVIGAAWRYKSTAYCEISRFPVPHKFKSPFGLYSQPNNYKMVFIGPYSVGEHTLMKLIPYDGVLCESFIKYFIRSQCLPQTHNLQADLKVEDPPYAEPELVIVPNKREVFDSDHSEFNSEDEPLDKKLKKQTRKKRVVKRAHDGRVDKVLSVSRKNRVRKVPQHLLDCETPTIAKVPETKISLESKTSDKKTRKKNSKVNTETYDELCKRFESYDESIDLVIKKENKSDDEKHYLQDSASCSQDSVSCSQDSYLHLAKEKIKTEKEKREPKIKTSLKAVTVKDGIVAEVRCNCEKIPPVPVLIYSEGSVRMRNPFGRKIVHFENLELAKRFLNFIFKTAVNQELSWNLQRWSGSDEAAKSIQDNLQVARARLTPLRLLNMAIGHEGRIRPFRVKWKPHHKKLRTSIQRVVDECEKNGAFDNPEIALLRMEANYASLYPKEVSESKPTTTQEVKPTALPATVSDTKPDLHMTEELPKVVTKVKEDIDNIKLETPMLDIEMADEHLSDATSSTFGIGPSSIADEDLSSQGSVTGDMYVMPRNIQTHRSLEKQRRLVLSTCFKTLATLLVPVDMLSRCSKIMVLQRALQEVNRVKKLQQKLVLEKNLLQEKRNKLLDTFKQTLEVSELDEKAKNLTMQNVDLMLEYKPQSTLDAPNHTALSDEDVDLQESFYANYKPELNHEQEDTSPRIMKRRRRGPRNKCESKVITTREELMKELNLDIPSSDHETGTGGTQEMFRRLVRLGPPKYSTTEPPPLVEINRSYQPLRTFNKSQRILYPIHRVSMPSSGETSGATNMQLDRLPDHVRIRKKGKIYIPTSLYRQASRNLILPSKSLLITNRMMPKGPTHVPENVKTATSTAAVSGVSSALSDSVAIINTCNIKEPSTISSTTDTRKELSAIDSIANTKTCAIKEAPTNSSIAGTRQESPITDSAAGTKPRGTKESLTTTSTASSKCRVKKDLPATSKALQQAPPISILKPLSPSKLVPITSADTSKTEMIPPPLVLVKSKTNSTITVDTPKTGSTDSILPPLVQVKSKTSAGKNESQILKVVSVVENAANFTSTIQCKNEPSFVTKMKLKHPETPKKTFVVIPGTSSHSDASNNNHPDIEILETKLNSKLKKLPDYQSSFRIFKSLAPKDPPIATTSKIVVLSKKGERRVVEPLDIHCATTSSIKSDKQNIQKATNDNSIIKDTQGTHSTVPTSIPRFVINREMMKARINAAKAKSLAASQVIPALSSSTKEDESSPNATSSVQKQ